MTALGQTGDDAADREKEDDGDAHQHAVRDVGICPDVFRILAGSAYEDVVDVLNAGSIPQIPHDAGRPIYPEEYLGTTVYTEAATFRRYMDDLDLGKE
jgi:hypothetical protein